MAIVIYTDFVKASGIAKSNLRLKAINVDKEMMAISNNIKKSFLFNSEGLKIKQILFT